MTFYACSCFFFLTSRYDAIYLDTRDTDTACSEDTRPTDFLKQLLDVDSISGTSLDENSCDGFSELLSFLHRNFPVGERGTDVSVDAGSLTGLPWQIRIFISSDFYPLHLQLLCSLRLCWLM